MRGFTLIAKRQGGRRLGGFTLIELLVTTAIIAMLTAVAAPATRRAQQKAALRGAASVTRAYVTEARELAAAPRSSSVNVSAYATRLTAASRTLELLEISSSGGNRTVRSETLPAEVVAVGINQTGVGALPSVTMSFAVPSLVLSPATPVTITLTGTVGTKFIEVNPKSGFAEVR